MHISKARGALGKFNVSFVPKQRVSALFFAVVLGISMVIPPASVFAAERQREEAKKKTAEAARKHPKAFEDPNKPMEQNYPGGMQPTTADEKAATDAKPIAEDQTDEFTKEDASAGEALQGVGEKPKVMSRELVEQRTAPDSPAMLTKFTRCRISTAA